jgi:hypothetical protein
MANTPKIIGTAYGSERVKGHEIKKSLKLLGNNNKKRK